MGLLKNALEARTVSLSAEHLVGRAGPSQLRLGHPVVSATHALVRWNGVSWEVRDLGSTNGTRVDGLPVPVGAAQRLLPGAVLEFGGPSQRWQLVDASPPLPAAIPLDGGEPCVFDAGSILIPNETAPVASIHPEDGVFFLEIDDAVVPLAHEQQFSVRDRWFRFDCPSGSAATLVAEKLPMSLAECTLILKVSPNEEHVALTVVGARTVDCGQRTAFYLLLVLARERLGDIERGAPEHGWIDIEELLRRMPEYGSDSHLGVDVHRLRRMFGRFVLDPKNLVERRRRQLRLGTNRVEIRVLHDAPQSHAPLLVDAPPRDSYVA
jgi:hypothetical protein